jgi:hypothetical protein
MSSDECAFNENPLKVRGGRRRLVKETGWCPPLGGHRRELNSVVPEEISDLTNEIAAQ